MTKAAMRSELKVARREFAAGLACRGGLLIATLAVAERVAQRFGEARSVAAYVGLIDEVDPLPILLDAIARGLDTALPRIASPGAPLSFHHWIPGDALESGPLGLQQPAAGAPTIDPEFVVTPLVGFDRGLARLGQGAGFYDRTFTALPHARRIGIAWSAQEVPSVPTDTWDMPLHGVATEREWIGPA